MAAQIDVAQARATARGLTGAKDGLRAVHREDPKRLLIACVLTPMTALALFGTLLQPLVLILAAPLIFALLKAAPAMRRYFIAFSPRNAFPRNLPAFVRWAALYSGVMLIMIALPPEWSVSARLGTWLGLAAVVLIFPLLKALLRARAVWAIERHDLSRS